LQRQRQIGGQKAKSEQSRPRARTILPRTGYRADQTIRFREIMSELFCWQGLPIAESYLWFAEANSIQKHCATLLAKLDN